MKEIIVIHGKGLTPETAKALLAVAEHVYHLACIQIAMKVITEEALG